MKAKHAIYIIITLLIISATLFSSYSFYKSKAKQDVIYNLRVYRDSVDEVQSRVHNLGEGELSPKEKEAVSLASSLLTKQSFMISTQLFKDHKEYHPRFRDLYIEFNEQLESAISNGDAEEVHIQLLDYKSKMNSFREEIESS
ncbi:hypothetical protein [Halobacillus faecis]|uniref:Uncharacterized protein n=1 Tax=Halobacillus faecis TaxID=360184 RepID=A0A511WML9_9BACI|nr:hypothetical protein [Halobacillus faecis]GEN52305.1 hypothetical protein HFA01_05670 [Halobacillus faecis]